MSARRKKKPARKPPKAPASPIKVSKRRCKKGTCEYGAERYCLRCGHQKDGAKGEGGGRPRLFDTEEALQKAIDAYFHDCDTHEEERTMFMGVQTGYQTMTVKRPRPYTVEGLAHALGMNRKMLGEYEDHPKFGNAVRDAKARVLIWKMEKGNAGEGSSDFIKFDLKNNFGYIDKVHNENTNRDGGPVDPLDREGLDPEEGEG